MGILILISSALILDVTAGGNHEEKRRAATSFALKLQGLPSAVIGLVTSNGHENRNCEGLEMGFFHENEWKRLKRVFAPNERNNPIRLVIDQHVDARTALYNAPGVRTGAFSFCFPSDVHDFVGITLNDNNQIIQLSLPKMEEGYIADLSNLPPHLINFAIHDGYPGNLEFSKLPKGLKYLTLPRANADSQVHIRSLPPALETLQIRKNRGTKLYLPLPMGLKVIVPSFDGITFQPEPAEIKTIVESQYQRTLRVKWDTGTQIDVICI